MELTTIDFIIIGIILFLSVKGFFTGFTREFLSFFGIIGGIAVASRTNTQVGEFITQNIYPITDKSVLELVGFIVSFLGIFFLFNIMSSTINRESYIGLFSRILGYGISIAKYIAIIGIILYGLKASQFLSDKIFEQYRDSKFIPILLDVGGKLLNQEQNISFSDKNSTSKDINLSNFNLR